MSKFMRIFLTIAIPVVFYAIIGLLLYFVTGSSSSLEAFPLEIVCFIFLAPIFSFLYGFFGFRLLYNILIPTILNFVGCFFAVIISNSSFSVMPIIYCVVTLLSSLAMSARVKRKASMRYDDTKID